MTHPRPLWHYSAAACVMALGLTLGLIAHTAMTQHIAAVIEAAQIEASQ